MLDRIVDILHQKTLKFNHVFNRLLISQLKYSDIPIIYVSGLFVDFTFHKMQFCMDKHVSIV